MYSLDKISVIPSDIAKVLVLGDNFALSVSQEKLIPITEYFAAVGVSIKKKPELIQFNILDYREGNKLLINNSVPSKIYGLLKLHFTSYQHF